MKEERQMNKQRINVRSNNELPNVMYVPWPPFTFTEDNNWAFLFLTTTGVLKPFSTGKLIKGQHVTGRLSDIPIFYNGEPVRFDGELNHMAEQFDAELHHTWDEFQRAIRNRGYAP